MVSFGCVAKVLSGFQCKSNIWIKTVNPSWYEAREIPTTMLKVRQEAQATSSQIRKIRETPKTAEPPKKESTPRRLPYF